MTRLGARRGQALPLQSLHVPIATGYCHTLLATAAANRIPLGHMGHWHLTGFSTKESAECNRGIRNGGVT